MELDSFLTDVSELLAAPSTFDRPEQLRWALDYVIDFVGPGFVAERFESGGKPSALLYPDPGDKRGTFRVILNAHLDVVPAQPEQFWPRRDGDRLYARGAQDMKVSGLLEAQVFRDVAGELPVPVALQLVTDEEVGGRHGTMHQLEQGVRGQFAILGEHSGLDIVADSKGMARAYLRAAGRAGHSAYPWLGDNALLKVLRSVNRLVERYPTATEESWKTTLNVARLDTSNQAFNQIPADAEAWLDLRFPPEDTDLGDRPAEEVMAYLLSFCDPGVSVEIDHLDPPHHADHNNPDIGRLRQAAREQGYHGDFLRKHGAADGRFYSQLGIPAVAFGIGGGGQHGPEEYVDLTTVVPYYNALASFLRGLEPPDDPHAGAT